MRAHPPVRATSSGHRYKRASPPRPPPLTLSLSSPPRFIPSHPRPLRPPRRLPPPPSRAREISTKRTPRPPIPSIRRPPGDSSLSPASSARNRPRAWIPPFPVPRPGFSCSGCASSWLDLRCPAPLFGSRLAGSPFPDLESRDGARSARSLGGWRIRSPFAEGKPFPPVRVHRLARRENLSIVLVSCSNC